MATSTQLPGSGEDRENPGQASYEDLADREFNPDAYQRRHGEPAGDKSDPRGDADYNKRQAEPAGDATDPRGPLATAETLPGAAHPDTVGSGYTGSGVALGRLRLNGFSRRQKIAGSAAALVSAGTIAFILFFLPVLRLESYLSSINQRVFGFASNAVSQRVEHLFERYMITRVIQLNTCGNNVTGNCKADYTDKGIAGGLFNAWRDAKVEQKLIDQFDLKFETNKNPLTGEVNRITVRSGKTGKVITLSEGQIKAGNFSGGDREFGREVNKFLRQETRWYEVMQRRSVRKYLVRKHDVKFWCFFACTARDNLDLKTASAKTRLKYKLVERIIYPFSPKLGFILDCIVSGGDTGKGGKCGSKALRERGIDRETLSNADIESIKKSFVGNQSPRLTQVLLERVLQKFMSQTAARQAVSTIPVAGQIYLAAVLVDGFDRLDDCIQDYCLSHFAADLNSRQYVEYYTAMYSASGELKAGDMSADEAGAIMDDFGGPYSAEQSLVYQAYNSPEKTSLTFLGGTAYAAADQTAKKETYLCADSKPIPAGELVCPEKKVARTYQIEDMRNNSIVDRLSDILNIYDCALPKVFGKCPGGQFVSPKTYIRPTLNFINDAANTVLGPAIAATLKGFQYLPYVGDVVTWGLEKTNSMMQVILERYFPLPIQLTSPGREKYDGLEAGGEVAAMEFGKGGYTEAGQSYGLGGQLLNPGQQSAILRDYWDQQNYEYRNSGFIAKLTNRDRPNSLANRFIAAMPTSISQLSQRFTAMMSRPFSGLSLGSPAFAATNTANINAFGINRYGYAVDAPALTADPALYTEEYCQTAKTAWENSKTEDPITGFDEYSTTNPCLLEQVAVESASAVFTGNDSLDDTSASSGGSTPAPPISGSAQQIAQQILQAASAGRVKFNVLNSRDLLDGSTPQQNVQQTANGQPASTTSNCAGRGAQPPTSVIALDINLLQFVLELSQNETIQINAIAGQCHSSTTSNHYQGKAVDFGCPFNTITADRIGAKYGISRNSESCADINAPHYHYSVGGG